jgi:hypothetical protein
MSTNNNKEKKLMIKIHNIETGEVIEREMTTDELSQYEADQAVTAAAQAEAEAREAQRQVILDRLGLTSEEARLILGS